MNMTIIISLNQDRLSCILRNIFNYLYRTRDLVRYLIILTDTQYISPNCKLCKIYIMSKIVNNLKQHHNPWHSKSFSNPFETEHSSFFMNRKTLPRTENCKNKNINHRYKSRSKYFDQKDDALLQTTDKMQTLPTQNNCRSSLSHSITRPSSQGRVRKGIFNNSNTSKLQRNSASVKKSAINMKINQLFFCEKCYLYLFKIQIQHHYPKCSSNFNSVKLSKQQMKLVGQSKLQRLLYTLQYTNHQDKVQIISQIENIKNKKYLPKFSNFDDKVLTLKDCRMALQLIFNRFFST